jgi:hypothetical protein
LPTPVSIVIWISTWLAFYTPLALSALSVLPPPDEPNKPLPSSKSSAAGERFC